MTDPDVRDYLSNIPFFAGLDTEFVAFLSQQSAPRRLKRGEVLFRQDERAETFYLVRTGRISVEIPSVYGPPLEIQNLGAGDILGWSWLISPYRWDFQARAEEDTDLLEFDGRKVLDKCEQDAAFGYELLKRFTQLMSERLTAARQRMMDQWTPPGFA